MHRGFRPREDEPLIRGMLVEALEEADFSTLVSGDAQGVVSLLETQGDCR